jgi:cytochrome c553
MIPESTMTPNLRLAVLLAFCAFGAPAFAAGDIKAGKDKVYTCTGCHGIPGYRNVYPHYHVPRIGGQNREYLIAALTAYQKGERKHPTMRAQAESFTAQDIDDIASYLSSISEGHK